MEQYTNMKYIIIDNEVFQCDDDYCDIDKYILLTDEQAEFYEANPKASINDILHCQLNYVEPIPDPDIDELKEKFVSMAEDEKNLEYLSIKVQNVVFELCQLLKNSPEILLSNNDTINEFCDKINGINTKYSTLISSIQNAKTVEEANQIWLNRLN